MSKILALIPARAGSKGVKNKNIRELAGKPLIAYTIIEAVKSNMFEDIIVSTDSKKIADIARRYGADVPFLRPKELALDDSHTIDVILHCLDFMRNIDKEYQEIILLQPTSPLRKAHHIKEAYQLFNKKHADFIISVCECEHSPLWTNIIDKDLKMDNFIGEEVKSMRRQNLPQYYQLNGAIYLAKVDRLIEEKSFLGKNSYAYIMNRKDSIDIDSEIDFKFCEMISASSN
ncbi:acylneuraminate cytidylyltransferase family protein [Halocella sp. SP3-1]|nr:acylneuraminate cytidylyltransferase family protein [Halocella sp. SP3-1]MTI59631.1 acylneuraminate cytidylyltransferase family protein [Bacillota bacterium]